MCNNTIHRPFNAVDPFQFSTFHFLRTCNRLMVPTVAELTPYYSLVKETRPFDDQTENRNNSREPVIALQKPEPICPEIPPLFPASCSKDHRTNSLPTLGNIPCSTSPLEIDPPLEYPLAGTTRVGSFNYAALLSRRQRGEKRPIPDEQKDEKYYERRKRNNEAAKKSRDARKLREDRIAFRAAILEQENAILRAQLAALREEMTTLRQLMSTRPPQSQISVNI